MNRFAAGAALVLAFFGILAFGLVRYSSHTAAQGLEPIDSSADWMNQQSAPSPVPNSIRVHNPTSAALRDRPITVSRFFAFGDIPRFASAQVDGAGVPTQCDVKTRWPDGSLQHAIVSFPISISAGGSAEVSFVNSESPTDNGGLDAAAMLSGKFDLGAVIALSSDGVTQKVDVREMIRAGHFRYWVKGPISTQVIVEEIGEDPAFDLSFHGFKSFHPIFILTFYNGHPGVRVDFIGENAWFTRRQDISYSLTLLTGNASTSPAVYSKADFKHIANSRWRKTFWSGPALPALPIDFNLPYLVQSRAIPSFDLSRSVPQRAVDDDVARFQKTGRGDLGDNCLYSKYMPTTGGRAELGIFTAWDTRYLYTFDPRLSEVVFGCADASGQIPIHTRESVAGKRFYRLGEPADALGRVISGDSRPGFSSRAVDISRPEDQSAPVGEITNGGWEVDVAHQPCFTFISYLLTGDWYYLEEMYFWAAYDLMMPNPGRCDYCAGSTTNEAKDHFGVFPTSTNARAIGWVLRTLGHAALMAPDGTPEKAYFSDRLINNIVAHEGRFNMTYGWLASDPSKAPIWDHGRNVLERGKENPLGFWTMPSERRLKMTDTDVDASKVYDAGAPWMFHVVLANLGYVAEFFPAAQPLRKRAVQFIIGELTSPDYNPYLVESYRIPLGPQQYQMFTTWAGVFDGFRPDYRNQRQFTTANDADFGYANIAMATASYVMDIEKGGSRGVDAWHWLNDKLGRRDALNDNPKWALVPRYQAAEGSVSSPETWSRRQKAWRQKGSRAR